MLRALDRIASLGHEIGLHNNAITLALLTGEDPHRILDRDLSALRRHGFEIDGSVAHGDPLCHKVGYVNNEIFNECPRPELGGPDRVIAFDDPATKTHYRLELHPRPMADFGLTYEANFIGHTRYLTDTGGRWNPPFARAPGSLRRARAGSCRCSSIRSGGRSSGETGQAEALRRAGVGALGSRSSAIRTPPRTTSSSAGTAARAAPST